MTNAGLEPQHPVDYGARMSEGGSNRAWLSSPTYVNYDLHLCNRLQ